MRQLMPSRARVVRGAFARSGPATTDVERVVVAGLVVTLVILVLQASSQAIDFGVYNLRVVLFNADKHYSVFGVLSLLAQVVVAAASVQRGREASRHRSAWYALAGLAAALVIMRGLVEFKASVVALPLAAVLALLTWLTWHDGRVRVLVWAGLVLLFVSLLLHKVGLAADDSLASDFTWKYQITGMVKHGAELGGWLLVVTGLVAGMATRRAPIASRDGSDLPAGGSMAPAADPAVGRLQRSVGAARR